MQRCMVFVDDKLLIEQVGLQCVEGAEEENALAFGRRVVYLGCQERS